MKNQPMTDAMLDAVVGGAKCPEGTVAFKASKDLTVCLIVVKQPTQEEQDAAREEERKQMCDALGMPY